MFAVLVAVDVLVALTSSLLCENTRSRQALYERWALWCNGLLLAIIQIHKSVLSKLSVLCSAVLKQFSYVFQSHENLSPLLEMTGRSRRTRDLVTLYE